jgi:hypothetical protein
MGKLFFKLTKSWHNPAQAKFMAGSQDNFSGRWLKLTPACSHTFLSGFKSMLSVGQKSQPVLCKGHTSRCSVKKLMPHQLFELTNTLA